MNWPVKALRRWHWPGAALAGAGFGLGAVMASGQAPLGMWYLALPALTALSLLVTRAPTAASAAWLGLFAGAGHFALALNWIIEPFLIDPETYAWMIPFAVVFLAFGLALFWALAAALAVGLARRWGGGQVALAWVITLAAAEFARGFVFTGFPWALLGHIWIDTPVLQLAAFIGPNGLTLLTVLLAVLPLLARWAGILAAGAALAVSFAIGVWQLGVAMPPDAAGVVRLVQPNAAQHLKWDSDLAREFLRRLTEISTAPVLPGQSPPDLVVWPETSVPYLLGPEETGLLAAIAGSGQGAQMAVGAQRVDVENAFRGYNSLTVIGPEAKITAIYDKHHLVPFGEYIPFGDLAYQWFGLSAFAAQMGNGYSAGPGPEVLDFGPDLGRALPLICYEAVFPQDLRTAIRADFILQITNDAWFGRLTGPWQHLAQARLRAVEQGLPFLRSANTGVSAVIDARGRILAQLPMGEAGHLDAAVPGALPMPFYAKYGDLPFFLALLGLFSLLPALRKLRRA